MRQLTPQQKKLQDTMKARTQKTARSLGITKSVRTPTQQIAKYTPAPEVKPVKRTTGASVPNATAKPTQPIAKPTQKVSGFPKTSKELEQWQAQGRTYKGGAWYEKSGPATEPLKDTTAQQAEIKKRIANLQEQQKIKKRIGNLREQKKIQQQIDDLQEQKDRATDAGYTGGEDVPEHILKGEETPIIPEKDKDEQQREDIAEEANQNAQNIFDNLPDEDVDMRNSAKILEDIQEDIEASAEKIPEPTSLADLFQAEKTKLGIEPLETELAALDADIERINTELMVQAEEAGEQLLSMTEIGREKGALQKRAEREIALINVERSAVARQLGNKIDTLGMIMDFSNQDFQNTSDYYQKEFTRNVQLYNLISGAEERELTHAERATDDARANLTTIYNALKDDSIDYNSLTTDQKLKISSLEAQAGLPSGFSAQISTDEPDKKIQTVSLRTDEAGNNYYDVLLVDNDGAMTVKSIFKGTVAPKEAKAPTATETKKNELNNINIRLTESKKGSENVDGNVYLKERRKSSISPADFDKRFSDLLSWEDKEKYGIIKKEDEEVSSEILKDLQDAVSAIAQDADPEKVRRRFLDNHPNEAKRYNEYVDEF